MIRNQAVALFFEAFKDGSRYDAAANTLTAVRHLPDGTTDTPDNGLVKVTGGSAVGLYRLLLTAAETAAASQTVRVQSSESGVTVVRCDDLGVYLPTVAPGQDGGLPFVADGALSVNVSTWGFAPVGLVAGDTLPVVAVSALYDSANDRLFTIGLPASGTSVTFGTTVSSLTSVPSAASVASAVLAATVPADGAGTPTTLGGLIRRVFSRGGKKQTRNRSNPAAVVRTLYADDNVTPLETRTQTTAGDVDTLSAVS